MTSLNTVYYYYYLRRVFLNTFKTYLIAAILFIKMVPVPTVKILRGLPDILWVIGPNGHTLPLVCSLLYNIIDKTVQKENPVRTVKSILSKSTVIVIIRCRFKCGFWVVLAITAWLVLSTTALDLRIGRTIDNFTPCTSLSCLTQYTAELCSSPRLCVIKTFHFSYSLNVCK